jgi:amidase
VLDPRTRENARTGSVMGGPPLAAAMAGLPRLRGRVGRLFDDVDVVLAPTTASPPLPVDTFDGLSGLRTDVRMARACPYTFPWNVLGWPGVNVPAGRTRAGLPVGAQLLGPDGTLELLVSVAAQLEGVRHWDRDWPPTRVETPSGTAR